MWRVVRIMSDMILAMMTLHEGQCSFFAARQLIMPSLESPVLTILHCLGSPVLDDCPGPSFSIHSTRKKEIFTSPVNRSSKAIPDLPRHH